MYVFKRNATIGKYFSCAKEANCINQSGDKSHIIIGNNCEIYCTLFVDTCGKIIIGDYTTIRYNSLIGAAEEVVIGDHVIISNNVTIRDNNSHPTDPALRYKMCEAGFNSELWKWKYADKKRISIGKNVWIGEYVTILKGINIAEGSIVAAHSVVTKDVPKYCIVAGNPSKIVKYL